MATIEITVDDEKIQELLPPDKCPPNRSVHFFWSIERSGAGPWGRAESMVAKLVDLESRRRHRAPDEIGKIHSRQRPAASRSRPARTDNEVLADALGAAEVEGIDATIYAHPPGSTGTASYP